MDSLRAKYLDEILHCCEIVQQCNEYLPQSQDPIYTLVGVMDWAAELYFLLHFDRRRYEGKRF
jgi:hypothetical protein